MSSHSYPTGSHSTDLCADPSVSDRLLARRHEYFGYFRRRLEHLEDAEDAFQDFCLKAVRAAGTVNDGKKTDAWLRCIRDRTLIDYYRRRAARRRVEDAYEREPQASALDEEPTAVEGACCCVRGKLAALRHDYADIIWRVDFEEQPRGRIAADLDISENNVGVRLHRARQALKAKLKNHCPMCGDGNYRQCDCEAGRVEAA